MLTGEVRDTDLIRVNAGEIELFSLVNSGVGFAAHLMEEVNQGGVRGRWEHIKTAIRQRTQIPPHDLRIINEKTGAEHTMTARVAEIVNAGLYGGMFQVTATEENRNPVKIDDGILNLFAVPYSPLFEPLQVASLIAYTGIRRHVRYLPPPLGVHYDRSPSFSIWDAHGESLERMHTDGEPTDIAVSKILYTNEPQEVTLVVPTQGERSYYS